jgi:hypothetical protein
MPKEVYVLIGHDHFGAATGRVFESLPRMLKLAALSPFVSQLPDLDFSIRSKKDVMAVLEEFLEAGKLTGFRHFFQRIGSVDDAVRRESGREPRFELPTLAKPVTLSEPHWWTSRRRHACAVCIIKSSQPVVMPFPLPKQEVAHQALACPA